MSIQISNRRNLIRRSTISGVVPTIPSSGVTSLVYPDLTWLDTDIMVGEFFMNTEDSKIWFRDDNGIHNMNYSGGTDEFIDLDDTPSSYIPGYYLIANSGGTALEWTTGMTDSNSIQSMTDYYGGVLNTSQTNYSLVVDASGSGFTLTDIQNDFTSLDDTPSSYSTAYDLLRVNSGLTGLELFDGSDTYVVKDAVNTINSAITFMDDAIFQDGISVTPTIAFTGLTTNVNINEVMTDTGFTTVNNSTLVTSEAIYYWVNSLLYSGTTSVYNFVTVDTVQSVTAEKTFTAHSNFTTLSSTTIQNSGDLEVGGDINMALTSYQYFGDISTDGSYRFFINVSGDLEFQKRVAGSWVFKGSF